MEQATKYKGIAQGSDIRWYSSPDTAAASARMEAGDTVILPLNYAGRKTNGMWPIIAPGNGWMPVENIGGITLVTETVPDACTPPETLTIDLALRRLVIAGGAGGEANELSGFGVSWRERPYDAETWTAWTADTVSMSRTVEVSASAEHMRQYRVRTRGSAGAAYYSEYVVCAQLVPGSTTGSAPKLLCPAGDARSMSLTPTVVLVCVLDEGAGSATLQRQIDSGSWTDVKQISSGGEVVHDKLQLEAGSHVVAYRIADQSGEGDSTGVVITVEQLTWTREIRSGDVISNQEISHREDIKQLLAAVNVQRRYYGLKAINLPGTVGRFGDWRVQMATLQNGLEECARAADETVEWEDVPTWPTASVIGQIRSECEAR